MSEIWDVYDEDAVPTGRTMKRGVPKAGDYMLAVHVYLYNTKNQFLLQKRSANKESHPGEWAVTGGAVLSGENSLEAAIRETKEEVGIRLTPEEIRFEGRVKKQRSFVDIFFAQKAFDISDCVLQKEEVEAVKLVSADEVLKHEQNDRGRSEEYMSVLRSAMARDLED